MEAKYTLEWREHDPVLLQRLRGFWSPADFDEYRAALHTAIDNRPAPTWLKISDVRGFKAQQTGTDAERVANARFEFDSGLATMGEIDEEAESLIGLLLAGLPRR